MKAKSRHKPPFRAAHLPYPAHLSSNPHSFSQRADMKSASPGAKNTDSSSTATSRKRFTGLEI